MSVENLDPFRRLIYKTHVDIDIKKLTPRIDSLVQSVSEGSFLEKGNAISTVATQDHPHRWHEMRDITNAVMNTANQMWHDWKLSPCEFWVENSWINIHNTGGETLEHAHGFTTIVATIYLHLPKDGGFIEFKDPLEYHWMGHPQLFPDTKNLWYEIPAITGDIIMFPGWLRHKTQVNYSTEDRAVCTMNISHQKHNVDFNELMKHRQNGSI